MLKSIFFCTFASDNNFAVYNSLFKVDNIWQKI